MFSVASSERLTLLTQLVGTLEVLFGKKHLAVWRIDRGRVSLLYGLAQPEGRQRSAVPRLCKRWAEDLTARRVVREAGSTLLPLVGDGLVGVVHLSGEPDTVADPLLPTACAALDGLAHVLTMRDVAPIEAAILTARAPLGTPARATHEQIEAELDIAQRKVRETERRRLVNRLEGNDWNVAQTARSLHWSRTTLWQRMRQLGIPRPTPAPTDPRGARAKTATAVVAPS